jgi:DNA-binding XRE family transcriptional regulator
MAKAFWVSLFICPAGTWHLDEPKVIQVRLLLDTNGFLLQKEHRNKDWYWQLRRNFEAALDTLVQKGAAVDWHYLPGCPPDTDQTPGAAENWLDAKISVTDPAAVPAEQRPACLPPEAQQRAALIDQAKAERVDKLAKGYRRKPKAQAPLPMAEPTGTITAAALKQWRNERGYQQGEMARRLDVTQQYYSLMEREKRPITGELTRKLQVLMNSPNGEHE